jgi:hypothetical protein
VKKVATSPEVRPASIGSLPTIGSRVRTLPIQCPRCGYDQRGEVATWSELCPINGICAECGLDFEWADVLCPDRNAPAWCVEYVARRAIARGCAGTFLRSFRPWRFWHRLRLSHPVRPGRLIVYVMMIFVLPALVPYVAGQAMVAVVVRAQLTNAFERGIAQAQAMLTLYEEERTEWEELRELEQAIAPLEEAIAAGWRPPFAYDPSKSMEEQFESQEDWEIAWQKTADFYDIMLDFHRRHASTAYEVRMSYPLAVVEAVFFPLSDRSRGRIEWTGGSEMYYPPWMLHTVFAEATGLQAPGMAPTRLNLIWVARDLAFAIGWILLFLLVFPVTFVLLPMTRKRAKVRSAHFVRIVAYSMFIPASIAFVHALIVGIHMLAGGSSASALHGYLVGLTLSAGCMAFLWWYFAIRTHLRLPNPFWVLLLLSLIVILIISTAFGYAQLVVEWIALFFMK